MTRKKSMAHNPPFFSFTDKIVSDVKILKAFQVLETLETVAFLLSFYFIYAFFVIAKRLGLNECFTALR